MKTEANGQNIQPANGAPVFLIATVGGAPQPLFSNEKSPLVGRNSSILAHGFQPIGKKAANTLFTAVLKLTEKAKESLLIFPKI